MQSKIWTFLSNYGVSNKLDPSSARYVILTNRFGIILGLITLLGLILNYYSYEAKEWATMQAIILITGILFFSTILFNRFGYYNFSKWMISWMSAIFIIFISISNKKFYPDHVEIHDFFSYRFLIMATTIIPLLIFSTKNIKIILINLLPGFLGLVFFNAIHTFFGVGFSQLGFVDSHLYILDDVVALAYFGLIGFLLNQRIASDKFEIKLNAQQKKLEESNRELSHLNQFVNEQNHEITTQSDRLKETNEALVEAKNTIEKQRQLLEDHNKNLEAQVTEKTNDLSKLNEELVINNNELRQFSHTLSHNLKSPVATCQGLLNLIDGNELNNSNRELFKYLEDSVCKMQDVFTDLNEMLELRNKLYTSIEHVDIQKEIDTLHSNFYTELRENKINFTYTFDGHKVIRTNAKRLNGILFQIINNAIKFRSDKKDPKIEIKFGEANGYYSIKIRDNGIGIDLEKYGNKLFYPYQRFHKQAAGKGLGLYLVKLQTESLGGQVKISSAPGEFTEVEVQLKIL